MDSENVDGVAHDLVSLLTREDRDFLVRNNGHQVKVESLKGKKIWLYFSASWCGPCRRFTPKLVEAYNELSSNDDFEIIFVSGDNDDESFNGYFSKMPWLAIPFSDSDARDQLNELFKVMGIPNLVMLDESGKVLSEDGVDIIQEYGVEAYPFTPEKIKEMKEKEETARKEQSLRSILVSQSRDYVISTDGKKVPVSELEGKFVGLFFSLSSYKACLEFTPTLVDVYEKLRAKGRALKLDKSCEKLARYFELSALPTLVVIGPDGKTLHSNVAEAIQEHGIQAYPFTPEKFAELEEIEKAKREAQTLESILVSGDRDFVIGKMESSDKLLLFQIPVSDLVGKNILLYFSAHWCPPCRAFLPKLIEAYQKIKTKDEAFEVIFISSDKDQTSFDEFFSGPWHPSLIAIGPTGRTVTTEARNLVMIHGADAYPFTEEHIKEIEAQYEEMAKGWPEKMKHALHEEHELVLTKRRVYGCNGCEKQGHLWSFYCEECDFDLHPKCALEEDKGTKDDEMEKASPGEGWKCDGEVCYKA
ncbi:putative nucleoredoxin 1 [Vitis vinifera]|uniref:protein-disulfide reductase n=1 Tax=Vitis vinifera TaxID=29760 RepID=A0A438EI39_VITVI|nr:putative nucleoredoxin 1 [Vitis vinifera]